MNIATNSIASIKTRRRMRALVTFFAVQCLGACSQSESFPINDLEILAPGLKIQIDSQGRGQFQKRLTKQEGHFVLSPSRLADLQKRLEPFRPSQKITSETELLKQLTQPCSGDYITDQGGVDIHWSGPGVDQWYSADFGCEPGKNVAGNEELQAILRSLPVPEPESLPPV